MDGMDTGRGQQGWEGGQMLGLDGLKQLQPGK